MLSLETRLKLNEAEVTATVIDGEAIMINLSNGVYYSMDGVGARIWQLASAGATIPETTEIITEEYAGSREQAAADVQQVVEQLLNEKLLLVHPYEAPPTLPPVETTTGTYRTPSLEIYREMGHLLAIDPPMPGLENIAWDESRRT